MGSTERTATTSISPPSGFTIVNEIPVPPLFTVWELESETERPVSQSMLAAVLQERVATYRDGPLK